MHRSIITLDVLSYIERLLLDMQTLIDGNK